MIATVWRLGSCGTAVSAYGRICVISPLVSDTKERARERIECRVGLRVRFGVCSKGTRFPRERDENKKGEGELIATV